MQNHFNAIQHLRSTIALIENHCQGQSKFLSIYYQGTNFTIPVWNYTLEKMENAQPVLKYQSFNLCYILLVGKGTSLVFLGKEVHIYYFQFVKVVKYPEGRWYRQVVAKKSLPCVICHTHKKNLRFNFNITDHFHHGYRWLAAVCTVHYIQAI